MHGFASAPAMLHKGVAMKHYLLSTFVLSALATPALAETVAEPTALRTSPSPVRLEGERRIAPSELTRAQLGRAGRSSTVGIFDVCVERNGSVSEVRVVRSTAFAAYDAKIQREIRSWKYQPVLLDGQPAAGCTTVTLVYLQK